MVVCATVLAALTLVAGTARSAQGVYHFQDESGVPHFSDVRVDERYRQLTMSNVAAPEPAPASRNEQCGASLCLGVPEQVRPGELLPVTVRLDLAAAREGWVELGFDPAVLACRGAGASTGSEIAGRLRLRVSHVPGQPFAARLECATLARDPTFSELRILAANLNSQAMTSPTGLPSAVVAVVATGGQ